ncbi:MAG: amino acid transporter [Nocardioidaceae bacterium]|nr:amino acid transporter [Nocardioidaceae bacterium]
MPRFVGVLPSLLAGLGFGLSLIVAIGAQNAFVLRQGLDGRYVGGVVLVCAASDALLIGLGVAGLGSLVSRMPTLLDVVRVAGALFLAGYAVLAARRALGPAALVVEPQGLPSRRQVLLTCLALTWLNPHVYLDTVLLLGTVAGTHGEARWWFGAGAALGSVLWFTALGYGAGRLRPAFAKPVAWRVLDLLIATTMAAIAVSLVTK